MILIPFIPGRLEDATRQWGHDHDATFADVSRHEFRYFDELAWWWRILPSGEPLAVIEHDIVPDETAWEGLWSCYHPWCVMPYPISNRGDVAHDSLGCVRWSGALRAAIPDLFDYIKRITVGSVSPMSWRVLDIYVRRELSCRQVKPHPHGRAAHLHDYSDMPA